VDGSLKEKLKCLIFVPIISQTYCDPRSFAWRNEFLVFLQQAQADGHGLKVRLPNGNMASRVLPIRIHDLDAADKQLVETELQGPLRAIDFTYHSAGVNRPLRPRDDEGPRSQAQSSYRDQINKAANSIKDIIAGMRGVGGTVMPGNVTAETVERGSAPRAVRRPGKWSIKVPDVKTLALAMSLVAVTVLGAILLQREPPDIRTYRYEILPPVQTTFSTGFGGHVALSPDGRSLAFVGRDSAGIDFLWVRQLSELTARLLNGTEGASFPFWSPDSRHIGFFAEGKLKRIEASGGPPNSLCEAPAGRGGAWSRDGTIIFCPSNGTSLLYRVSASGGNPVAHTRFDSGRAEVSHRWPSFLPDSEHFIYSSRTQSGIAGEDDAIFVGSLDTTFAPRLIVSSGSNAEYANGHLLFTREQNLMAQPLDAEQLRTSGEAFPIAERAYFESFTGKASFSVSADGLLVYQTGPGSEGTKVFRYDRAGNSTLLIHQPSVFYNDVGFSPDARRIAISHFGRNMAYADIWLYEITRPSGTRFTFDATSHDRWPVWSPDGNTVVFASNRSRGGLNDLYQRASSGAGGEEKLLESNSSKIPTDWSRDGKYLAYHSVQSNGSQDLWILPMTEERKPFAFLQTPFNESFGRFSPDGRWMAYQSDESGRFEVYVRPFPGPGGKWQVSTNGGSRPRWRGDGKELFYDQISKHIMSAEIGLAPAAIEIGEVKPLFQISPFRGGGRDYYDVSADGQVFLVITSGEDVTASSVTVVVNWAEEIKK
jgi:Tol biopolymer transport system component